MILIQNVVYHAMVPCKPRHIGSFHLPLDKCDDIYDIKSVIVFIFLIFASLWKRRVRRLECRQTTHLASVKTLLKDVLQCANYLVISMLLPA